jgi:DNA-binding NtrC family response regulator
MEQILVVDPDTIHSFAVAEALRRVSRSILTCTRVEDAIVVMEREALAVIVVVADIRVNWYADLDAIRHVALGQSNPPRIVCLLRGPYCGPSDKVYGARKGFTVIYEQ